MKKPGLLLLFVCLCGFGYSLNVTVPANIEWTDTGVHVQTGQVISITATGKWRYDPRPQYETGPDGVYAKGGMSEPGGRGTLQGKIGNGTPWMVASNWSGVALQEGELYLGMQDGPNQHYDNVGEVYAQINTSDQLQEILTVDLNESVLEQNQTNPQQDATQQPGMQPSSQEEHTPPQNEPTVCGVGLAVLGLMLVFEFARGRVSVR